MCSGKSRGPIIFLAGGPWIFRYTTICSPNGFIPTRHKRRVTDLCFKLVWQTCWFCAHGLNDSAWASVRFRPASHRSGLLPLALIGTDDLVTDGTSSPCCQGNRVLAVSQRSPSQHPHRCSPSDVSGVVVTTEMGHACVWPDRPEHLPTNQSQIRLIKSPNHSSARRSVTPPHCHSPCVFRRTTRAHTRAGTPTRAPSCTGAGIGKRKADLPPDFGTSSLWLNGGYSRSLGAPLWKRLFSRPCSRRRSEGRRVKADDGSRRRQVTGAGGLRKPAVCASAPPCVGAGTATEPGRGEGTLHLFFVLLSFSRRVLYSAQVGRFLRVAFPFAVWSKTGSDLATVWWPVFLWNYWLKKCNIRAN